MEKELLAEKPKTEEIVDVLVHKVDQFELGQQEIFEVVKRLESGQQAFRAEVREDIRTVRDELGVKIDEVRTELKSDIAELRTELKGDISGLRIELKGDISDLAEQVAGGFVDHETRVAALEKR